MSVTLTTELAVQAMAWGRAPKERYSDGRVSHINTRVVCADGFKVSVQASPSHYCDDSSGLPERLYWRSHSDVEPVYPFTLFEVGNPSDDLPDAEPWNEDGGGIWAWVKPEDITALLDGHGGAVRWEKDPTAPTDAEGLRGAQAGGEGA